jgi:hypothetical protein
MAANKTIRLGPANLTGAAANVFNCAVTSMAGPVGMTIAQPYMIIKHIRVVNRTAVAHNFELFIGATGGSASGTEFVGFDTNVPANSYVDWYGSVRLDSTDFLTGKADTTATLTIQCEGEIGISG